MNDAQKPLQVVVHHDVLCAWCYVADQRLDVVRKELGDVVRFKFRPYPLRPQDALPTGREVADAVRELTRAQKEPEGLRLRADLWKGADLPRSSVPALAALEAARLQGPELREELARVMQRAALEQGINVTRSDVVFELAARAGLQMSRFSAAFASEETRQLIFAEHRLATSRGVKGVPTLVIGGRWMVSGLREVSEYREHILTCLGKLERSRASSTVATVH